MMRLEILKMNRDRALLPGTEVVLQMGMKTSWEEELGRIYKDLDEELAKLAPSCRACGDCCHFEEYGHKLYVSDMEADYMLNNNNAELPNTPINNGVCPYLADNKCTIREYRSLGCRIFYCQEDWEATSSDLYERYLRRIKDLCTANGLKWNYAPMPSQLSKKPRRSLCLA